MLDFSKSILTDDKNLFQAIWENDIPRVIELLQAGPDLTLPVHQDYTPLHLAARWGRFDIAVLLLEYGATVDASSRAGMTPLHYAAALGSFKIVQLLLMKGADVNSKNRHGNTPLHEVARTEGVVEIAMLLLENGADRHAKNKENATPQEMAKNYDHLWLALRYYSHYQALRELWNDGFEEGIYSSYGAWPPKEIAEEIIELLLGINTLTSDERGGKLLHAARAGDDEAFFRVLQQEGHCIEQHYKESSLLDTAINNHLSLAHMILKNYGNEIGLWYKFSALKSFIASGNHAAVNMMLSFPSVCEATMVHDNDVLDLAKENAMKSPRLYEPILHTLRSIPQIALLDAIDKNDCDTIVELFEKNHFSTYAEEKALEFAYFDKQSPTFICLYNLSQHAGKSDIENAEQNTRPCYLPHI